MIENNPPVFMINFLRESNVQLGMWARMSVYVVFDEVRVGNFVKI